MVGQGASKHALAGGRRAGSWTPGLPFSPENPEGCPETLVRELKPRLEGKETLRRDVPSWELWLREVAQGTCPGEKRETLSEDSDWWKDKVVLPRENSLREGWTPLPRLASDLPFFTNNTCSWLKH